MPVGINPANVRKCICSKCPSHPGKLVEMLRFSMPSLYCASGKSKSKIEKKGCTCGECLVQKENKLTALYYCIEGKAQRTDIAWGESEGLQNNFF